MKLEISKDAIARVILAAHSRERVSGLTHNFYRYPARFSPVFARAAIEAFTSPGDLVVDPFMGGGTTLVEAASIGRRSFGTDVSELSCFVSRVKTSPMSENDERRVRAWIHKTVSEVNLRSSISRPENWIARGYQRNLNTHQAWPIRKLIELMLSQVSSLKKKKVKDFCRAIILRTAQWALDSRKEIPSASEFRLRLIRNTDDMLSDASKYLEAIDSWNGLALPHVVNASAESIGELDLLRTLGKPRLILTSPPYPGVHVLYHRWQIRGRKETPAPFWIANANDGSGPSFYTFGDRKNPNLDSYYRNAEVNFSAIAGICSERTILAQLVAFPKPSVQLPRYLDMLKSAGFEELEQAKTDSSEDGRTWRQVPNRKWYAKDQANGAGNEVVLFHHLHSD